MHSFNGFRKIEGANPTSISEIICIHNTVLVCPLFIWHYLYASFFSICICFPDCLSRECQTSKKHTLAIYLHNVTWTLSPVNACITRQESLSVHHFVVPVLLRTNSELCIVRYQKYIYIVSLFYTAKQTEVWISFSTWWKWLKKDIF